MPIDPAARSYGVSVGMLSKLVNGKGVNLEMSCVCGQHRQSWESPMCEASRV